MLPRLLRTQGRCTRHRNLVLGLPPWLWAGLWAPWLPRERRLEGVGTTGDAAGEVLAEVFWDDMKAPGGRGHSVCPWLLPSSPQTGGALQWAPIPAQDVLPVPEAGGKAGGTSASSAVSPPLPATPSVCAGHWAQSQTTEPWLCLSGLALQVWLPCTPTDRWTDGQTDRWTDGQCPVTNCSPRSSLCALALLLHHVPCEPSNATAAQGPVQVCHPVLVTLGQPSPCPRCSDPAPPRLLLGLELGAGSRNAPSVRQHFLQLAL